MHDNLRMVEILLRSGVDITKKDNEDDTVLIYAVNKLRGQWSVLNYLLACFENCFDQLEIEKVKKIQEEYLLSI